MTNVKAALSVVLKADDVIVAEVQDPVLWQHVLTAINAGKPAINTTSLTGSVATKPEDNGGPDPADPLGQLALQIGIDANVVRGACSPTLHSPYLHLDAHCWEAMKKAVPSRGTLAIAPIVVAATLLGLWFHKTGLGNPTQAQAQEVLGTVHIVDKNASRAIQNTSWLQGRGGGQIVINPAEISQAVKVAKCFCTKQWSEWKE
jgi:hypothetical protein